MQVKLGNILDAEETFKKLIAAPLPAMTAFQVSRFIKEVDSVFTDLQTQRKKLFEKYGIARDGRIDVLPENEIIFFKELNDLLALEVELKSEPLTLKQIESVVLTAYEITKLEPFLKLD